MNRRTFLKTVSSAGLVAAGALTTSRLSVAEAEAIPPMALGLLIKPSRGPEQVFARVHDLGFSTCFENSSTPSSNSSGIGNDYLSLIFHIKK